MPPEVIFTRSSAVPDELWNALGRTIDPGTGYSNGGRVRVPLERFLARRHWLSQLLAAYGCEIIFEPAIAKILQRAADERAEVQRLLATSPLNPAPSTGRPFGRFHRELKWFQTRDLAHLLALSHGANFSVPGAGKTAVAYACYEAMRMNGQVQRLLVVAPLSSFEAWEEEASLCMTPAPVVCRMIDRISPRCEVLLVNYHRLASKYDKLASWVAERPSYLVIDEAHRIKAGRPRPWPSACLDLSSLAARRDILTGTPAPNHPKDFAALIDFLWPHQARRVLPAAAYDQDPTADVMRQLSQRLQPFFVRTKKDELGLPKLQLVVKPLQMKPLQANIYRALRARLRQSLIGLSRDALQLAQMSKVVMYLIEAATNPGLLAQALGGAGGPKVAWPPLPISGDSDLREGVVNYTAHEMPAKFECLATMIAKNARQSRKTLVWTNFRGNFEELERVLAPYGPAAVHGGVPTEADEETFYLTREAELRRFRQDDRCMVLLANPAAMAEGVSLHLCCHDAIYVDRTFNAGQYLQSVDRIHRLGLARDARVRITFLVAEGTIDEVIQDRVAVKARRLSQMLSDPNLIAMALPDEEEPGATIDSTDLQSLFAHLKHG